LNESLTQLQQAITQANITQCKLKVSDILDWEKLINQLEQEGEIIDALNLILTKRDFYQEDVFKAIAQVLLEKKPNLIDCNEEELVRCNRLLLEVSFPQLILKAPPPYTLKPIASSRYWQPTEPVILMVGEGVKPTIRHGQDGRLRDDGLLECEILQQERSFSPPKWL